MESITAIPLNCQQGMDRYLQDALPFGVQCCRWQTTWAGRGRSYSWWRLLLVSHVGGQVGGPETDELTGARKTNQYGDPLPSSTVWEELVALLTYLVFFVYRYDS